MKQFLFSSLLFVLLLAAQPVAATQTEIGAGEGKNCRQHVGKKDCDSGPSWCRGGEGACRPEMRGRCGKRRGDWYGASQPVATALEARTLLLNHFTGQEFSVSGVIEKKWGFRAEILDKDGKIIDRVMIDKRSGRIRSLD